MANGIDFSRLRQQNLFATPDINQGGIMGNVDFGGGGGFYGEGPQYVPPNSGNIGEINFPNTSFGDNPFSDPRQPVNQNIGQPPVAGPGSKGVNTAEDLMNIINQIYTPSTVDRDRNRALLDAAPEREGPGVLRGISAGLMGLGAKDPMDALKIQESVMFAPHNRAMADWTAKTTPFSQASQQENTANINERTLASNVATATVNQNRYDQQNQINEEKNRIAEYRAESERILRNAQAYMQSLGKGYKPITVGTSIKMYNESTGEIVDTGMTTDKMTEEAKITLQNLGRVNAAAQMGVNAAAVAGINQSQVYTDGKGNYWQLNPNQVQDAATMGLRPVGNAPQFPSGQINPVPSAGRAPVVAPRVARNDKFQQLADERPDLAQKWLIPPVSSTGNWGIKPPPAGRDGWFWDTPVDQNEMNEYNAVREALGLPPMPNPVQPAAPAAAAPAAPQGSATGIGPKNVPQVPQGQPGVVNGQQRYQQPPVDFSQQPSTRTGVGGVPQSLGTPTQESIVASELAKGTRLTVTNPTNGQVIGSIPNTPEAIQAATQKGLRVDIK